MPWRDWERAHLQGIEASEEETDAAWAAALLLLLRTEASGRAAVIAHLRRMPTTSRGTWDTRDRAAWTSLRRGVSRDVDRLRADLVEGLTGTRAEIPGDRFPSAGIQSRGIRRTISQWERAWQEGSRLLEKDLRRIPARPPLPESPPDRPGGGGGPGRGGGGPSTGGPTTPPTSQPPAARTAPDIEPKLDPGRRTPRQIRKALKAAAQGGAGADEMASLRRDGLENIMRHARSEMRRLSEESLRLVSRYTPEAEVYAHLLGQSSDRRRTRTIPDGPSGWQLNRNNMRLAVAAHVRAAHRLHQIEAAQRLGIQRFRLDVPKARLGKIAPTGVVGRNLWRVRTLEEWQQIQASANRRTVRSSAFHTLGLGFGDVAYVIPVPAIYAASAVAGGLALRKKHRMDRQVELSIRLSEPIRRSAAS